MAKTAKVKDPNKLGLGRLLVWKSGDVAAAGVAAIVLTYLNIYCTDTLGLNPAILGTILMVTKIIDAAVDIFYAWLIDNTNTKLGRGRPYEIAIVGQTLTTILLFSASPEWELTIRYIWVASVYILVFAIFQSLRNTAQNAYTIRAFSNNNALLEKVSSYGGMITMIGSTIVSIAFPIVMNQLATSASGWTATLAIFMVPLTLIGVLRFIFIKEDPTVDAGRTYQKINIKDIFQMFRTNPYVWFYGGMLLCFNISTSLGVISYYFKWVVGDTSLQSVVGALSFVMVPLMLTFPFLMKKLGSMAKMVSLFCGLSIFGYAIAFFAGGNVAILMAGMFMANMVSLPMSYYGILFITRCAKYNEMNGLAPMESSSGVIANFAQNFGGALGSFISGILLTLGNYNYGEGVTSQPDSALFMIRIIFAVVPAILVIGSGLCAWQFVGLEKKIAKWEEEKASGATAN